MEGGDIECTAEMEEIMEKLKLLNYEKDFVQKTGNKSLNRAYFAIQTNSSEQFNTFKQVIEWLFKLNEIRGVDFFSDPNTIAQNILFEMKSLGHEYDFPPLKLVKGAGYYVCQVLLDLVNLTLSKKFKFKKPIQEKSRDQVADEGAGDIGGDDKDLIQDDNMSIDSEDDLEDAIGNDFQRANEIDEDKAVIESKITFKEWTIECQRVAPKLVINPKSDTKEWRSHIESLKTYQDNIRKQLPDSRTKLERVSEQLGRVLDSISKSEKNINSNMNDMGGEYREKSQKLKQIMVVYNNLNSSVKEMGEQYRQLTEKYEQIESKINDHGENVTNTSPVVKIKTAIQKIKTDIKQMDLRIGVLNHTVLQHKLTAKKNYDGSGGEIEHLKVGQKDNIEELEEF
ncbi:hypothetical protein PPERSA_04840 [Pseudocohnilembus persalinus]|uniref:Uncharacterized protein n=1 Tax=Pseudocohnilembus persalinus TaxID=266149 RepID=A0A0V0QJD1_PSEPJ|nr:hypothetical protein PPERSA_04840 [Pseudocohnilembus persalinus]|eukprot:KRX02218.1 hypothetical protein PPERSA_04840 [Pseudocohnilembus persalinus]